MLSRPKIQYHYVKEISFVRNDRQRLNEHFELTSIAFGVGNKLLLPLRFFKQFVAMVKESKSTDIYVVWFGGYHSFLPALMARWTRKHCIIIPGGSDCVSFPEINYGNFRKPIFGWFTKKSYELASHIVPVHDSLRKHNYHYTSTTHHEQGYEVFAPHAQKNHTEICIGYDDKLFKPGASKKSNSFLTVAQMDRANFFRKGIDLMVQMANQFPECAFTLVGYNPKYPISDLPSNFRTIEAVPYEDLPALYAQHEFYLQLSMMEGFPSAPCEAMLCGCIPIVSSVAALPNIAGDCGFILEKKDAELLTDIIRRATSGEKITRAVCARNRIQSLFPFSTRNKLVSLIRELADSRR